MGVHRIDTTILYDMKAILDTARQGSWSTLFLGDGDLTTGKQGAGLLAGGSRWARDSGSCRLTGNPATAYDMFPDSDDNDGSGAWEVVYEDEETSGAQPASSGIVFDSYIGMR